MISHHHRCLFVHIPKNAGQSIEHVFLNLLDLKWETRAPLLLRENDRPELGPPRLAHLRACEYTSCKYLSQELFDNYFKFSFVRNPWSRMVSFYKYLGFQKDLDFRAFLKGPFQEKLMKDMYWFVRPQCDYLRSDAGELLVDYVGRFEELQAGFDHVCRSIGLPQSKVPHVNNSKEKTKSGKPGRRQRLAQVFAKPPAKEVPLFSRYQDYYDEESRDFVAKVYRDDVSLFGYTFEPAGSGVCGQPSSR